MQEIKAKQSLHYAYTQVSFDSKVGFFSQPKTVYANWPQILNLAFVVDISDVLQLKNTRVGLSGSQEIHMQ